MRAIDGLPVSDAEKPVTIRITEADCEKGSKKDPGKCAAALALKRDTACDESRVHLGCTYLRFGGKWLRYATPPSLKAEIISFDRGGGFYPGDFRLYPMHAALRLRPARKKRSLRKAAEKTSVPKKSKAETTVFHRVKGVREPARKSG